MDQLATWRKNPDPAAFPFDEVVREYRREGKHFVAPGLLAELAAIRESLPEAAGAPAARLARFLGTALDKHDSRYDNPRYLALEQLGLPGADGCPDPAHAARHRDRLLCLLLADVLRFELATLDGNSRLQPEMPPDRRRVEKRCRHALRAMLPALQRQGVAIDPDESNPLETARRVCGGVLRRATPAESRTLQLTAMPVSRIHDEYMFLRGLQAYEITFALIAVQLRGAIAALGRGNAKRATGLIEAAPAVLGESSPLWSFVATMQVEAFLAFREFTDGASAIQSRSYKVVESLCREPDAERLDSPAYTSVPEVRQQVIAGQASLDCALVAACDEGIVGYEDEIAMRAGMDDFQAAMFKWRKTHHSMAVRMLGERRGTGYTEGVGYLEQGRTIPVFTGECPMGHASPAPACPVRATAAGG